MGSAAAAPAQRSSGARWWHGAHGDRGTVQLGAGSNFFSERAAVHWHRVSRERGSPDTGGAPEPRRSGTEGCDQWAWQGVGLRDLRGLFQPSWLCDCMTTPAPVLWAHPTWLSAGLLWPLGPLLLQCCSWALFLCVQCGHRSSPCGISSRQGDGPGQQTSLHRVHPGKRCCQAIAL